uniref:N-acetylglucosaminylphosphatidylinositol deacetylase n=1 Tax=Culicoides sonorensis TaxID=179676 RepID=A0A336M9X5_CULSO
MNFTFSSYLPTALLDNLKQLNTTTSTLIFSGDQDYANLILDHFVKYISKALEHLVILLVIYTLGCILLYWLICYSQGWWRRHRGPFRKVDIPKVKRVLIVTAHPDDESMFFAPTILSLKERDENCRVFILCLSNGNFDKKGKERRTELWNACEVLSIDQSDVTLLNATHLQDDPNTEWKVEIIAQIVLKHIEALDIQLVITFDKDGVSHHPNHCAIFFAVASLCISAVLPKGCKVLTLESVNVLRKYISLFDLPISLLMSILSWANRRVAQEAMCQHKSQLLWFRRLYIIFSRFMIINSLQEIDLEMVDLDLLENS